MLILCISRPGNARDITRMFRDIVLRIDTCEFSLADSRIVFQDQVHLAFRFRDLLNSNYLKFMFLTGDSLQDASWP